MIAANDPLIWLDAAGNLRDRVLHRLDIPIKRDLQVNLCWPGSNVIRNRKRSAPLVRRHGTGKRSQERLRVAVRNRQHWYLGDAFRLRHRQTLGVWCRTHAWRKRISRANRSEIHYTATLHSV